MRSGSGCVFAPLFDLQAQAFPVRELLLKNLAYSAEVAAVQFDAALRNVHASPPQRLNAECRKSPVAFAIGDRDCCRFCAPCVPTWRRSLVSVAQADRVIIAFPGDKCKMSIYDKTPQERGLISTGGFAFCGDLGITNLYALNIIYARRNVVP